MQNDKFETFKVLLADAFKEIDAGQKQQSVTIVSRNGYNLSINITLNTDYMNIVKNAPKKEFNEPHFLFHLPYEFGIDFSGIQLREFFTYLKSVRNITSLHQDSKKDALFLFTDNEIILLMREKFDNTGIN